MSNVYLLILLALLAGVAAPLQTSANNRLTDFAGSPVLASFISFVVGTVSLFLYVVLSGVPPSNIAALREAPIAAWTGGLLGAFFVVSTVILLPRLGVAMTFGLVVAGQMTVSLFIDHFGLLGAPVKEMNIPRFAGILLITAGVVLIRRF